MSFPAERSVQRQQYGHNAQQFQVTTRQSRSIQNYNQKHSDVNCFIRRFIIKRPLTANGNLVVFWQDLSLRKSNGMRVSFDDQQLGTIIDITYKAIRQFKLSDLSRIGCSFAKLGCRNGDQRLNELKGSTLSLLSNGDQLDTVAFACMTRAFVLLNYNDEELINAFKKTITSDLEILDKFQNKDIVCMYWSFANFGCNYKNDGMLLDAIKVSIKRRLMGEYEFTSIDLKSILESFSKLGCSDQAFLDDLYDYIQRKLEHANRSSVLDLSKILYCLSKLRCRKTECIDAVLANLNYRLRKGYIFQKQDLVRVLKAISDIKQTINLHNFLQNLESVLIEKLFAFQTQANDDFDMHDLWSILQALHRLKSNNEPLLYFVKQSISQKLRNPNYVVDGYSLSNLASLVCRFNYIDYDFVNTIKNKVADLIKIPDFFDKRNLHGISLFISHLGIFDDDDFLNNYKICAKRMIDHGFEFDLNEYVNMALVFISLGKTDVYPDFMSNILRNIEIVNREEKADTTLSFQLLKILHMLSLETTVFINPWSEGYKAKVASYFDSGDVEKETTSRAVDHLCKILQSMKDELGANSQLKICTNQYESGVFIDIALIVDDKKIAIEAQIPERYYTNTGVLKQKYLTKLRVLKKAGWDVIEFPHYYWDNMDYKTKGAYILSKIKEITSPESVEVRFEMLSLQDNVSQQLQAYSQFYGYQLGYLAFQNYRDPSALNYHQNPYVGSRHTWNDEEKKKG